MKKFKVVKRFKDIHTGDFYEADSTIEVTEERFKEIQVNLSKHDETYIEEIKTRKSKKKAEQPTKEEGA